MINNIEIWKPCLGFEGYYEASNLGRIRSLPKTFWNSRGFYAHSKSKILNTRILQGSGEYFLVDFCIDKEKWTFYVHRLVYEAFKGKIPDELTIDHIDENTHNNFIENLEVVTINENLRRSGENRKHSKGVYDIDIIDILSNEIFHFDTCLYAAQFLDVSGTRVRNVLLGYGKGLVKERYQITGTYIQ